MRRHLSQNKQSMRLLVLNCIRSLKQPLSVPAKDTPQHTTITISIRPYNNTILPSPSPSPSPCAPHRSQQLKGTAPKHRDAAHYRHAAAHQSNKDELTTRLQLTPIELTSQLTTKQQFELSTNRERASSLQCLECVRAVSALVWILESLFSLDIEFC